MGLITLLIGGAYASHLTTRLENAINPPRSRAVDQVNIQLVYRDVQLSEYGEEVVTGIYTATVLGVFILTSLPFILLGIASAGLAIPLIFVFMFVTAVTADSVAMWAVWRVLERENK
jgi:hypothetical protein